MLLASLVYFDFDQEHVLYPLTPNLWHHQRSVKLEEIKILLAQNLVECFQVPTNSHLPEYCGLRLFSSLLDQIAWKFLTSHHTLQKDIWLPLIVVYFALPLICKLKRHSQRFLNDWHLEVCRNTFHPLCFDFYYVIWSSCVPWHILKLCTLCCFCAGSQWCLDWLKQLQVAGNEDKHEHKLLMIHLTERVKSQHLQL